MKKLLCVLLALSLILSMGTALATEMHEITSNVFPFYDGGEEPSAELTLYFMDGANDLPYVDANDFCELYGNFCSTQKKQVSFSQKADGLSSPGRAIRLILKPGITGRPWSSISTGIRSIS